MYDAYKKSRWHETSDAGYRVVFSDKDGNYAKPEEAAGYYLFRPQDFRVTPMPRVNFTSSNHTIYKGRGRYVR